MTANRKGSEQISLRRFHRVILSASLGFVIPCAAAFAQAPDNSRANQGERGSAAADQQAENQSDRDLARKIRKSIMDDKKLSAYAHNVKIIARNGTVILKGPVRTDEEKTAIEAKAVEIAGAANVKDETTVKPPKP